MALHTMRKISKATDGKHLSGTRKAKDDRDALEVRGDGRHWKKQWKWTQLGN